MKYGYHEVNESPSSIEEYTDGAHIIVLRNVNNFISTSIELEDEGWELHDSINVLLQKGSLHATLFRKPFKGTVANNVLENGCGGINIDASRIATNGEQPKGSGNGQKNTITHGDRNDLKGGSITPPEGRFPANLLLECTCEKVIEGKSEGVVINKKNSKNINDTIYKLGHSKGEQEAPRAYKDEGATHTDSKCPCKKLDVGGASRFFFSFKSKDELKEYLTTLIRC